MFRLQGNSNPGSVRLQNQMLSALFIENWLPFMIKLIAPHFNSEQATSYMSEM